MVLAIGVAGIEPITNFATKKRPNTTKRNLETILLWRKLILTKLSILPRLSFVELVGAEYHATLAHLLALVTNTTPFRRLLENN
jgi:hypothetical protein